MKLLLLLVVVLSVTAYGNAEGTFPPTMRQIHCVFNLVEKMAEENAGLEKWHAEFREAFHFFVPYVRKCKSLAESEKEKCFETLKNLSYDKYMHLYNMLPENLKPQFVSGSEKCIQPHLFQSDIHGEIHFPFTVEEVKCAMSAVQKLVVKHPIYQKWGHDVKLNLFSLQTRAKKCEALHPPKDKKECYRQLNVTAKYEIDTLLKVLTDDIRDEFAEEFFACFTD